jgi:FHA domain/Double zinc ribbon
MSVRCPDGHSSESTDYCDTCGLPIEAAPSSALDLGPASTVPPPVDSPNGSSAGSPGPDEKPCPNCSAVVPGGDLFCEVCGYDFTTGALPAPVTAPGGIAVQGGSAAQLGGAAVVTPAPHPAGASVSGAGSAVPGGTLTWVAEVWVDPDWYGTQESDEPCPSAGMPVVVPLWDTSVLVGRRSASRNIHPQVDCGADHGVSRRHAQLTTDGQRWWAEDLQSSNGTFFGPAGAPLPTQPITPGQRVEFAPGDRVYVGAWTRIVVRKATPDEQ